MKQKTAFRILTMMLVFVFVVTACAPAATAVPTQKPSDKPYQGTTLRFVVANHPWMESIKTLIPEVETKT